MTVRHDWGTHYLGWMFYQNEPWQFPIGNIDNYFYPVGTNVGFTDSIPLLAISFKLFASVLPADFQYFGIWLFICHLLTAYYTILLFRVFKIKDLYTFIGVIFIAANPVLVYRGLHPALCGQWLIIAAIYLYFLSPVKVHPAKILLHQFILLMIAALVNPYLCFMVLGFSVITGIKLCFSQKAINRKYFFTYIAGSLFFLLLCWYIVGMLNFNHKEDIAVISGFGLYGLNLNSLFNPQGFSTFLPQLKMVTPRQYEGFSYLGLGIFLILFILLLYALFSWVKKRKDHFKLKYTFGNSSLVPLFILLLLFTLFSISHVVTFDDRVLFTIPVPKIIIKLGDIFRASARFFWTAYYLIFIFAIIAIIKSRLKDAVKLSILGVALVLQLYDTKLLLTFRHLAYGSYEPPLDTKNWNALFSHFDEIAFYPPFEATSLTHMDYQDFCYLAAKAKKPINTGYVARLDNKAMKTYHDSLVNNLEEGRLSPGTLYITSAANLHHFSFPLQTDSCRLNYLEGYYYMFAARKSDHELGLLSDKLNSTNKEKIDSALNRFGKKREFMKIDDTKAIKEGNIRFFIERYNGKDGYLSLAGWAFNEAIQDNKNDSIFVLLKGENGFYIARTVSQIRPDITSHYKRKYLDNAGFNAQIFNSRVENGIYKLCIAVKDMNGSMVYTASERIIKVGIPEYPVAEKLTGLPPEGNIIFNAESVRVDDKLVTANGWAFLKDQGADSCKIGIVLKNNNDLYLFIAAPQLRPDVTAHFKTGFNLDNAGFTIKLLKASLPKGKYQLGILIRDTKRKKETVVFTGKEIDI